MGDAADEAMNHVYEGWAEAALTPNPVDEARASVFEKARFKDAGAHKTAPATFTVLVNRYAEAIRQEERSRYEGLLAVCRRIDAPASENHESWSVLSVDLHRELRKLDRATARSSNSAATEDSNRG